MNSFRNLLDREYRGEENFRLLYVYCIETISIKLFDAQIDFLEKTVHSALANGSAGKLV